MESFNNLCLKWWDGFYSSFQNSCSMTCVSSNGTLEVKHGEMSILMGVGGTETSTFLDICGIPNVDIIKFNQVLCQIEMLCMPKIILMYEQYKSSIHLENKNGSDMIFDSFQIMDERSGQTDFAQSCSNISGDSQTDARVGHIRIISANDEFCMKTEAPDEAASSIDIEKDASSKSVIMQSLEESKPVSDSTSSQNTDISKKGSSTVEPVQSLEKSTVKHSVRNSSTNQVSQQLTDIDSSNEIPYDRTFMKENLNSQDKQDDQKIQSGHETNNDKSRQNVTKCVSRQIRRSSRQVRISSRFGEDSKMIKNLIKPETVNESERLTEEIRCICSICKAVFSGARPLTSHWKSHKESKLKKKNKPFFCYKCSMSFCNYLSFKRHSCSKEHEDSQKIGSNFEKENITARSERNGGLPFENGNNCKDHDKDESNKGVHLDGINLDNDNGIHPCTFCSLRFMTMISLRNHLKSHGRKPWKCNECGKQFSQRKSLAFHMSKLHQKTEHFQCHQCSEVFYDLESLERHVENHTKQKTFFCEMCGKGFYHQKSLLNHQRQHKNENEFQCQVCQKSFLDKRSLDNHQSVHTGEKPHVCEICGKRFRIARGLINHSRLHDKSTHLKCDQCPKTFIEKKSFEAHKFVHSGIKPFACGICGKTFRRMLGFQNHSRLHDQSKAIKCDVCGKFFVDKWGMLKHKTIHTGEKPFSCEVCGKSFRIKRGLHNHIKLHDKSLQYKCELCPRTFVEKRKLDIHVKAHRGEKAYVCDECGQRFMNSMTLKVHKRRHTGEKPYKCSFCDKAFNQQGSLIAHERHHKGEKPYICEVCGDGHVTKSHLTIHRRKHFNDRPYKCDQCDYAAFTHSLLRIHMLKHSSEKPYKCHMCTSAFKRPHHLDVHMRTHLGTEKCFQCQYCNASFTSGKKFSSHLASHEIFVVTPHQSSTENNLLTTDGLSEVAYDIVLIS